MCDGVRLSPDQALGVMAVFAAVRVISEDVAKLPAKLRRTTAQGRETAHAEPEHIVLSRIGKPATDEDDGFTAMEWIEAVVAGVDGVVAGRQMSIPANGSHPQTPESNTRVRKRA